ncbi:hypothetical protein [Streptomyces natalensis]|uniref:Uncharacterized protein n=1 Tax=Streptomyces natalensis ATCC 27448 TaxID=1240678 RepID=A0A0D7CGQ2_9ACTN|nr:hypothetical protein [Streptomyces natalensis]KIZ15050.1 hypothetical protein SNA_29455 [Streptomyces natalensis ATCC 27448]
MGYRRTRSLRLPDGAEVSATGTGIRLSVLLDDLDTEMHTIPTGHFEPRFVHTPIREQAARGRYGGPHLHLITVDQKAEAAQ